MTTTSIAVTYTPGDEASITPVPECIGVDGSSTVTLTFTPTPPLGEASTKYTRLFGNGWLKARNDDATHPERIVITVVDREGEGFDEYKFDIKIKGTGKLDPRIVVE
jgi:hypothetical protein